MRKIIIIVVALLLLGGGGAGAYFYFQKPAEAASGDAATATADSHGKDEKKHAAKGGGHGAGMKYVELDPLILPIVDNNGLSQSVSLVIALEVADDATAKQVEGMSPKLKDAYIQDMYGMLNEHAALKGGVIQITDIKNRLNKITHEVMGEDVVHEVLLQVVQQRPI